MTQPLEPLSLIVHSVESPTPADATLQRTTRGRLKMLAVLLVCAAPVVASYVSYYLVRPQGGLSYGTLIQPPRAMPQLSLRDLDDRPVRAASLTKQWLLLAATGSQCQGDCERLIIQQRQLREMLGRDRDRVDRLWLVLDDGPLPPALLQAVHATAGATVLRARRSEVLAWLAPEPGRTVDDHLYVIDPMGDWMMRMPAEADPGKVKRDLERLLRASASWDRAGR